MIATFDVGTTAVKAVLVAEDGSVAFSASKDVPTVFEGSRKEQNPNVWWNAFLELSAQMPHLDEVNGIVMSGQMQDVIPVDDRLQALGNAILYSDGRGEPQSDELIAQMGADRLTKITGNAFNGTLSLAKILWIKQHEPERYRQTRCFLISSKDYLIAQLTGQCVGDLTACSTAGAMELDTKRWSGEILAACGVERAKLPTLYASHEQVGSVTGKASSLSGYREGTPVFAGVGDAGATTLASGIARSGQYNINLGTSGWIATVSDHALQASGGVFNLAAMPMGKVINVVPFLNAGNVHHWVTQLFSPEEGQIDYENMNTVLASSEPCSHGVFALPYLVGERFPVPDAGIKGAYLGITPETTKADMARAMLEGVAYSIRQGLESIGTPAVQLSVIGGGGRVKAWCQILADILGKPLYVYHNAETLPARAIAAAALIGLGKRTDYDSFIASLQGADNAALYQPNAALAQQYDEAYRRYQKLYPLLSQF